MSDEWERHDEAPDPSVRAVVRTPALPSVAEHNPAAAHWRDLEIDPDLAGLAPGRARPSSIVISVGGDRWPLPVDDVLPAPLAWHPRRPLVAGLAVRDRRAHVWIADYHARTCTVLNGPRAAVSFTAYGHPPVAWCGDRLVLLIPGSDPEPERPQEHPVVFEAAGPGVVAFEPPAAELQRLAGARLAVLDPDTGASTPLTPVLLVRSLLPTPAGDAVTVSHGRWSDEDGALRWTDVLLDLDAPERPRPAPPASEDVPPPTAGPGTEPAASIPVGPAARLVPSPPAPGPLLLWIRAFSPGEGRPCPAPFDLHTAGHPVATLDLPLHWPADAALEPLHTQIVDTIAEACKHWDGPVAVGGHSFGATLALYALAHLPDLVAAVAHSGCYNRTLTPTGFHYERRSYWDAPDIYRAFSALHFADRLDRPVLLVHGAEDGNPATPPEQSVGLYRAIVATGGRARLVLLPHEGHHYRYRETHRHVAREHRDWMARW
ncbi:alpha/beta hydrolase family protein [Spirillospora sp. NPDC127200]